MLQLVRDRASSPLLTNPGLVLPTVAGGEEWGWGAICLYPCHLMADECQSQLSHAFTLRDGSLVPPATKVSAVLSRKGAGSFLLGAASSEGQGPLLWAPFLTA